MFVLLFVLALVIHIRTYIKVVSQNTHTPAGPMTTTIRPPTTTTNHYLRHKYSKQGPLIGHIKVGSARESRSGSRGSDGDYEERASLLQAPSNIQSGNAAGAHNQQVFSSSSSHLFNPSGLARHQSLTLRRGCSFKGKKIAIPLRRPNSTTRRAAPRHRVPAPPRLAAPHRRAIFSPRLASP